MSRFLPIILIAAALAAGTYVGYLKTRRAPVIEGPALVVEFLDADLGCAVVVRTPEGQTVVIDPGPLETAGALAQYLHDRGVGQASVLISNPSDIRAGALESLLDAVTVTRLWRGQIEGRTRAWKRAMEIARGQNIPEKVVSGGTRLSLSKSVLVETLSPPAGLLKDADRDNNSLVVRISYGSVRFLLLSDAGTQAEGYLISSGAELSSDVLAVGRHGRTGATSLELLRALRPRVIVVGAGIGEYGPSPTVLARIDPEHTGADLYRTDRDGVVTLATDGESIVARTEGAGDE